MEIRSAPRDSGDKVYRRRELGDGFGGGNDCASVIIKDFFLSLLSVQHDLAREDQLL